MGGTNKNKDWVKGLWWFVPGEKKSKEINIINNLNQTFKKTIVSENSTLDKTAFLDTAASMHLLHKQVPTENYIPQQRQKLSPSQTDTRWKRQKKSKSKSAHFQRKPKLKTITIPNGHSMKTSKKSKSKSAHFQRKPKLKTFYQDLKTTSLLHHRSVMPSAKSFFFKNTLSSQTTKN